MNTAWPTQTVPEPDPPTVEHQLKELQHKFDKCDAARLEAFSRLEDALEKNKTLRIQLSTARKTIDYQRKSSGATSK